MKRIRSNYWVMMLLFLFAGGLWLFGGDKVSAYPLNGSWGAVNTPGVFQNDWNTLESGMNPFIEKESQLAVKTPLKVSTPYFQPAGGTYTKPQAVKIGCATAGAKIYWSTNNGVKWSLGSVVMISKNCTLSAKATKSGMAQSTIVSMNYVIKIETPAQLPAPYFQPIGGTYTNPQTVKIQCGTPGTTIYWSTNDGATWKIGTQVLIDKNCKLSAKATKTGISPSVILSMNYIFQTALPVFGLPAGTYTNNQSFTITCATPGAVIKWSTNIGTTWVTSPNVVISKKASILAEAQRPGWNISPQVQKDYVVYNWRYVGNPGFSPGSMYYTSLSLNHKGDLCISFMDNTKESKLTVMRFNGSTWLVFGPAGFSAGCVVCPQLAGYPGMKDTYIAYKDWGLGGKGVLKKCAGTSWVDAGTSPFTPPLADFISLSAIPSTGVLYSAFCLSNGNKLSAMKYNGSAWSDLGNLVSKNYSCSTFSLVLHPLNGNPFIAFDDIGLSFKARVIQFNGTSWSDVGAPGFSSGRSLWTSIAFDNSCSIYISYKDYSLNGGIAVKKYVSGNWKDVGTPNFSGGSVEHVKLGFIPGKPQPIVAFMDHVNGDKASVMYYNGVKWVYIGQAGFTPGRADSLTFFIHPIAKQLYIAFHDEVHGGKATVMKFSAE